MSFPLIAGFEWYVDHSAGPWHLGWEEIRMSTRLVAEDREAVSQAPYTSRVEVSQGGLSRETCSIGGRACYEGLGRDEDLEACVHLLRNDELEHRERSARLMCRWFIAESIRGVEGYGESFWRRPFSIPLPHIWTTPVSYSHRSAATVSDEQDVVAHARIRR